MISRLLLLREMKTFTLIWFGQVISMIGSGITGFGVGVWVYQETGSVTLFAVNSFLNFLPRIVLSPMAGVLADRWSRRRVMLRADSGAALSTVFLALVFLYGNLEIWHIYLITAANAIFNTFQAPAYGAAVTMMVPKEHFVRASAMLQLGGQVSMLVAPTIAGFLLLWGGLPGIMIIDFITFLVAISILMFVRFPEPESKPDSERPRLIAESLAGWRYVTGRPGLRGLLSLSGFNLFFIAVNATLSIPILLTMTTVDGVGVLAMLFGAGGIIGGLVITA